VGDLLADVTAKLWKALLASAPRQSMHEKAADAVAQRAAR
jgi:hypothetical protein